MKRLNKEVAYRIKKHAKLYGSLTPPVAVVDAKLTAEAHCTYAWFTVQEAWSAR